MLLQRSGSPGASCRDPVAPTISPMAKKDARDRAVVCAANADDAQSEQHDDDGAVMGFDMDSVN